MCLIDESNIFPLLERFQILLLSITGILYPALISAIIPFRLYSLSSLIDGKSKEVYVAIAKGKSANKHKPLMSGSPGLSIYNNSAEISKLIALQRPMRRMMCEQ